MKFSTIRGTRDIFGIDIQKMRFIEKSAQQIFSLYGYEEIRTPIFEETGLFTRSIGESTDIVEKEIYSFTDKGGRRLTLRPEGTASVVRAYLQDHIHKRQQVTRLYYMGPMFRYERPQAGRFREFRQIGAEIFGVNSPSADAEMILMNLQVLHCADLKDISLHINSVGCVSCRADYIKELIYYAKSHLSSLCDNCKKRLTTNPLRILDCKSKECKTILVQAPHLTEYLDDTCKSNLNQVISFLENAGVQRKDITIDPNLVRGLDYYTGVVFEFKSGKLGAQDAVSAGGRYNRLVEDLGGPSIPAVGFALGTDRLIMLFPEELVPAENNRKIFIAVIAEEAHLLAFQTAQKLRAIGCQVEVEMLDRSIKSQLSYASDKNFTHTVILGEDELTKGYVTLKNMQTKTQQQIPSIEALIKTLSM
ncbi:MAG: histidine--tRNA ligase [bacterium]